TEYAVDRDDGDGRWHLLHEVHGGDGGRDYIFVPQLEVRRLRVRTLLPVRNPIGIVDFNALDDDVTPTADALLSRIAGEQPRGDSPRGCYREQSYWTVVGVDGAPAEGLLDEDARFEVGRGQFSLEPFLATRDTLYTWADGRSEQSLAQGSLPIPTATRIVDSLALSVTLFARGEPGHSE